MLSLTDIMSVLRKVGRGGAKNNFAPRTLDLCFCSVPIPTVDVLRKKSQQTKVEGFSGGRHYLSISLRREGKQSFYSSIVR
jgi:hypothetical protein